MSEDCFLLFSTNPDEMQHYAAFHLGLHCLPKYPFMGTTQNVSEYDHEIPQSHNLIVYLLWQLDCLSVMT